MAGARLVMHASFPNRTSPKSWPDIQRRDRSNRTASNSQVQQPPSWQSSASEMFGSPLWARESLNVEERLEHLK